MKENAAENFFSKNFPPYFLFQKNFQHNTNLFSKIKSWIKNKLLFFYPHLFFLFFLVINKIESNNSGKQTSLPDCSLKTRSHAVESLFVKLDYIHASKKEDNSQASKKGCEENSAQGS